MEKDDSEKLDRYQKTSKKKGAKGLFETFLRTFRNFTFLALFTIVIICCFLIIGIGLIPSSYLILGVWDIIKEFDVYLKVPLFAVTLALSYLLYGFTIILVVPFINWFLRIKLKPFKCIVYSLESIPWFIHNALTYILRYTFARSYEIDIPLPNPSIGKMPLARNRSSWQHHPPSNRENALGMRPEAGFESIGEVSSMM